MLVFKSRNKKHGLSYYTRTGKLKKQKKRIQLLDVHYITIKECELITENLERKMKGLVEVGLNSVICLLSTLGLFFFSSRKKWFCKKVLDQILYYKKRFYSFSKNRMYVYFRYWVSQITLLLIHAYMQDNVRMQTCKKRAGLP